MVPYYKFSELLEKIKTSGLKAEKNFFLNIKNDEELRIFKGSFLIVSDSKKSKKYFLTFSISNENLEDKYNDYPSIFGQANYAWAISLVYLISNEKDRLFVWGEGVLDCDQQNINFSQGPGEISLAYPEEIIDVIRNHNKFLGKEFYYSFSDYMILYNEYNKVIEPEIYYLNVLKNKYHLI